MDFFFFKEQKNKTKQRQWARPGQAGPCHWQPEIMVLTWNIMHQVRRGSTQRECATRLVRAVSLSLSLHARDGVPRAHQRARKQEQELASDVPCSKLRPALRSSMPAPAQQQTLHTTHRNTAGFPLLIGIHVFFFSRLEKIKYKRKRGRKKKKKRGRKRKENNKKKE